MIVFAGSFVQSGHSECVKNGSLAGNSFNTSALQLTGIILDRQLTSVPATPRHML
jgi:hypothetical protein